MKKAFVQTLLAILCCFALTGCMCKHQWIDATCTSPQRCSLCNKTTGQPTEHTWTPATCQTPKTCTVCGTTEGTVLPHSWVNATCTHPKTCSVCGVTEGDKLPHTPSDTWVTKKTSYIYALTTNVKTCISCGEEVRLDTIKLDTLHDGTYFLISADDFISRLDNILNSYTNNSYSAKGGTSGGNFACGILNGKNSLGILMFTKNESIITKSERKDSCGFNKILGTCDAEVVPRVSVALIQTADPSIDFDEAKEYAEKLYSAKSVTVNGITYVLTNSQQEYLIGLTIE